MKRIAITPAMVNAVESAIHFAHGYEVGGHLAMLRAMSRRGLIKMHDGGGTLTDRGVWLYGYLLANGEQRRFSLAEMDGDAPESSAINQLPTHDECTCGCRQVRTN
jgi:hypothetical protein